ncbi:MAG: hypothetical protein Q8L26_00410 [Candidatus Omnitrophota bacterium]|nr:hypothetical protein [Candidatus Omnitrophota bacterium]
MLETKFKKLKREFYFGTVNDIKSLDDIGKTSSSIRDILLNT